eukprot:gb/GECG01001185.1/.p1 GENE.gb/GECG01001185.1/~~gb/GECG01001185.1/.p1  ORF type:complete len:715 (+),score=65.33 gb/GECG01001185.1/:1-2145(+)
MLRIPKMGSKRYYIMPLSRFLRIPRSCLCRGIIQPRHHIFHGNGCAGGGAQARWISSLHGIDVTCNSPDAVTLYDTAVSQYLALSGDPAGNLEAAMKHDPGFVLAHSMLAVLYLLSGNASGQHPVVMKLRRRAQILVSKGHCTHRERIHVAAMTALAEGRWREATAIWEAWLLEQPVDALTVRHLHDAYFFLGDKRNLKDSVGRVLGAWDSEHPEYLKVCGMFAFGAEECNNYQLAEDQGMRALSQDTRDPWALHAVVHVYEMLGRRYEGQRLLRDTRWFWSEANLLHCHLHWHWGLFQIEEGQFERSFIRYDWWIRENHSPEAMDLVDAASFLWRLELTGNNVFDRWEELVPYVEPLMHTHAMVFVDAHIAMVLAAAGRDELLQEFLDSMRQFAYGSSLYSEAYSSSIISSIDPVEDVDWMWSGVENEWTEEQFEAAARNRHSGTDRGTSNAPALSARTFEPGFSNQQPIEGEISYFPTNVEDPEEYDTSYMPIPDFELGDHLESRETRVSSDPFKQQELTAHGAGGYTMRPVLTCPMSSLPVLPLRPHSTQEDGVDDVVSLGGVGGFGLGSHSIHDQRYLAASIGVPLVEGLIAYRHGHYELCVDKLMPLRSLWMYIGGSHAQLDVFNQTLEAAATQSKQYLLSRALLRERVTKNPNSGLAMYHLSSILFGTGEYRKAAHARDRALRLGLGEERVGTPQVRAMTKTEDSWYQ